MSQDKVNVMVDIETLDVEETAVILSIGATTIESLGAAPFLFYKEIAVDGQFARTQSIETLEWWKTQSNYPGGGVDSLPEILREFSNFLRSLRADPIIWCKGTDFDTKILAHAFKQAKLDVPWKYNHVRDFRTVKKLFPVKSPPNTNFHNALGDAVHQALELKLTYEKYNFILEN